MKIDKNYLKKRIIYKLTYSGTKESDLIYKIMILNKIADFSLSRYIKFNEVINTSYTGTPLYESP